MRKLQSRLTVALLFTALALITFFVTTFLSAQIDFLYRDATGLSSARSIAGIVSLIAVAVLFIAGFIIAIPFALQPASFVGKIGKVLPLSLLLFALVAVLSGLMGIGAVGNLANIQGVGQVTFIAAWLGLAAVLATIGVVIASRSTDLAPSTIKSALRTTVAGGGLTAVATLAMLASVVIVATSQPASFGGPGGGGFPGGPQGGNGNRPGAGQNAPGGNGQNGAAPQGQQPEATGEAPTGSRGVPQTQNQQPAATQEVPTGSQNGGAPPAGANGQNGGQGQRPEGTGEPQAGFPGGNGGNGQNGGFPPGGEGGPGGPGGGSANITPRYALGGALMTLFVVIGLTSGVNGLTVLRQVPATSTTASTIATNYSRQGGLAVLTLVGIGLVVVGVIQLVPVTRDNPPVKTPINWDSEQTKKLVYATCMDCHSNETTWPWYASVAPSSWLTTMHVHDGRAQLNLSEMDSMPSFMRQNIANNMANQIRSGSMPPKDYLILHPDARLTDAEKDELITGLQKSLGGS